MALTYTEDWQFLAGQVNNGLVTSATLTIALNDVVVAMYVHEDNALAGTLSISNSGTALSWQPIAITNTNSNTKVGAWYAVAAESENRTVTVQGSGGNPRRASIASIVHTGAHATTPVPAGNRFSGTGGTDVTQSITPTSSGSALWMIAGDWSATNTFAAATNCTRDQNRNDAGAYTSALFRPTTQPRTDALSFTIGETDTSGTLAWIAFEVQAAAVSSTNSGVGTATSGTSGIGIAAAVGVGTAGSPTTLYSRPYLNVSAGNWLGSSGSQLANDIDEPTASDTDYIYDANTGVDGEYRLEPIPDAGTQYGLVLHYRPEARWWDSTIVTTLLYGSTTISQWADSLTANAGATTLDKTLTVAEITAIRTASSNASIWTDLRLRHSATQ